MRPIAPRIDGADEYVIAENQLEFAPIVACHMQYPDGTVARVCRWTLNPEERQRVAAGEDVYFLTPAQIALTPHKLQIGPPK